MTDWSLPQLLGIDRAPVTAVTDRPPSGPVVTGSAGLTLDGAASRPIRPRVSPGPEVAPSALGPEVALWVPDAGRWRQGATLDSPRKIKGAGGAPGGTWRVLVEWVVDRTGRLAEASYAVSEVRGRDEMASDPDDAPATEAADLAGLLSLAPEDLIEHIRRAGLPQRL